MKLFDTFIMRAFSKNIGIIREKFKELLAIDSDAIDELGDGIFQLNYQNESMMRWEHPFVFNEKGEVAIDARPFFSDNGDLRKRVEYNHLLKRAKLEHLWVNEPGAFIDLSKPLATLFSQWITGAVGSRMNAGIADMEKIRAVTYVYYWLLVQGMQPFKNTSVSEMEGIIIRLLTRDLQLPGEMAAELVGDKEFRRLMERQLDNLGVDLDLLTDVISEMTESSSIELTPSTLVVLISTSWTGYLASSLSALALENPPTLIYMVLTALQQSYYKRTPIAIAIKNTNRKAKYDIIKEWYFSH